MPIVQGWAEVVQTAADEEAQILVSTLRAADLDAQVFSQKDHAHMLSIGGMAVVRVLVPAAQHGAAVDLLAMLEEPEDS